MSLLHYIYRLNMTIFQVAELCLCSSFPSFRILWPGFSHQFTPKDPFFQNWNTKFQIICALHTHFKNSVNCQLKMPNFHTNLTQFTSYEPPFLGSLHQKRPSSFGSHTNGPFFLHLRPPVYILRYAITFIFYLVPHTPGKRKYYGWISCVLC